MEQVTHLTVQEAAQSLGVADITIRAAILGGRLPATIIYGRKVIASADVEVYRQRTQPDGKKRVGRPHKSRGGNDVSQS